MIGKGYLQGTQTKYEFLPAAHTDFVFSVIGEELGFLGAIVALSLFCFLIWRALYIGTMVNNRFHSLLAVSLAFMLTFHVFVNVGMTIGVMPVVGLPLPFLSYGGSSLVTNYISSFTSTPIGMSTEIMALRSWWTSVSAGAAAYAVVGLFVIENHCSVAPVDHRQLAIHLLERGYFDRALVEARRAAREADSQVDGQVISALAYLGLERPQEAVASIVDAIRSEPDDARLFATLREIALQSDRVDLVLHALADLAPELPAPNWHLRVTLAWTHMRLKENDAALPLLEEAVDTEKSVDLKNRLFAHLQLSNMSLFS